MRGEHHIRAEAVGAGEGIQRPGIEHAAAGAVRAPAEQIDPRTDPGIVTRQARADDQGVGAPDRGEVEVSSPVGILACPVAHDLGALAQHEVQHRGGGDDAHHPGPGAGGAGGGEHRGAREALAARGERDHAAGVLAVRAPCTGQQGADVLVLQPLHGGDGGQVRAEPQIDQMDPAGQLRAAGQQQSGLDRAEGERLLGRQRVGVGLTGGRVHEARQIHGDHGHRASSHSAQQLPDLGRGLGAAADAEDRIEHQVGGLEQLLEPVRGELGQMMEGAARVPERGRPLLMEALRGRESIGRDPLAAQHRRGVQPVTTVRAGAGQDQQPLRGAAGCGAAPGADVAGERAGGAQHERLPCGQQGCLCLAHRRDGVAEDHRSAPPSAVR